MKKDNNTLEKIPISVVDQTTQNYTSDKISELYIQKNLNIKKEILKYVIFFLISFSMFRYIPSKIIQNKNLIILSIFGTFIFYILDFYFPNIRVSYLAELLEAQDSNISEQINKKIIQTNLSVMRKIFKFIVFSILILLNIRFNSNNSLSNYEIILITTFETLIFTFLNIYSPKLISEN